MKKIAITGLSGVIGKVLSREISQSYHIIDLFHKKKYAGKARIKQHIHFDLLDKPKISSVLENVRPDIVIHMAAITHIDRCEMDKKMGKDGTVWKTNVEGSHEIAKYCAKYNIPMLFLSTECVFDGKKKSYNEKSKKRPINWYGVTKSEAEDLILSTGAPTSIIRSVVAYHKNDSKKTIYGKILNELKSKNEIYAVSDQLFTPTHTPDIVRAIRKLIENRLPGIYHVAPENPLSPYDLAVLIARKNKYSHKSVKKAALKSFYNPMQAALRLSNACLSGRKTNKILEFTPKHPENVL